MTNDKQLELPPNYKWKRLGDTVCGRVECKRLHIYDNGPAIISSLAENADVDAITESDPAIVLPVIIWRWELEVERRLGQWVLAKDSHKKDDDVLREERYYKDLWEDAEAQLTAWKARAESEGEGAR